eukprot:159338_1
MGSLFSRSSPSKEDFKELPTSLKKHLVEHLKVAMTIEEVEADEPTLELASELWVQFEIFIERRGIRENLDFLRALHHAKGTYAKYKSGTSTARSLQDELTTIYDKYIKETPETDTEREFREFFDEFIPGYNSYQTRVKDCVEWGGFCARIPSAKKDFEEQMNDVIEKYSKKESETDKAFVQDMNDFKSMYSSRHEGLTTTDEATLKAFVSDHDALSHKISVISYKYLQKQPINLKDTERRAFVPWKTADWMWTAPDGKVSIVNPDRKVWATVVIIMLIFCLGLAFGMVIYWGYSQKRALDVKRKKVEMSNWIDDDELPLAM